MKPLVPLALAYTLSLVAASSGGALALDPPGPRRTEVRERCASYAPRRRAFFGDLHVHTSFSWDAHIFGNTSNAPRDAYEFARGAAKEILFLGQPYELQLRRPLDFAAVTDHAEYFGETRICSTPSAPGYSSFHCKVFRGERDAPQGLGAFQFWGVNLTFPELGDISACVTPASCDAAAVSVWQDTRDAAEEAYDRTSECSFTSFVAYEYTGSSGGFNGHRNVIFRNDRVPPFPTSSFETGGTDPPALWAALRQSCLEGISGCEVLTIPHNANLSGGTMFEVPQTVEEAATRALFEPLAEIAQIKGGSECRFDRIAGRGAGTSDEECAWEQRPQQMQTDLESVGGPVFEPPIDDYPPMNVLRNVLKAGLLVERNLGANPFRFGFIGSTDTHNGTPGAVEEDEPTGNHGGEDDTPAERIRKIDDNPGALAVLWAEENSRDALFEAMRRRETYATSGTRPIVRFFGGYRLRRNLCRARNPVRRAYAKGVPMGGELPPRDRDLAPRFYVSALKDPGTPGRPGTDLQRIQIVKGWVDAGGVVHEQVYDVAGEVDETDTVDAATCAPVGEGFAELCSVWEDPDFDPGEHAFYYARVLENPSCRWSTHVCKQVGVDPFSPTCEQDAAGTAFERCCLDEMNDPSLMPVTQERAWTSPIWYHPPAAS
ncbi:MAG: DUF3604 domain-containing protein [Thermodesulfobacteriota bacterium]